MNGRMVFLFLGTALCLTACGTSSKPENAASNQSAQQQTAQPPSTEPPPAATEPTPPPEPPKPIVIPAGRVIAVFLDQALSSKSSHTGDSFSATVGGPVSVDGKVVIPKSSIVKGTVVEAKAKGKVKGEARLKLALTSITIGGNTYPISTTMTENTSKGKGKRTAATTGGGAAVGAIIGGIAGGGKGAAIGAGVGAGAGFVGGALTGNNQIELPAETLLSFQLTNSVTLK
jgi:hypothetical protein